MLNWNETKARLKQKMVEITESNNLSVEAKQEKLLVRLEVKLGKSREVIIKLISEL